MRGRPSEGQLDIERKALELRRAGVTYEGIAERVGYQTRNGAHRAVARVLARNPAADVDAVRELETDRLDRLLVAVWPVALKGDAKAVDQVLKIAERRARLLGLDVPTTVTEVPKPRLIWEEVADGDDARQGAGA
jgi:hypothetical protein